MVIYPKSIQCKNKMRERGQYNDGWPIGAVVHFTAGHMNPGSGQGTIDDGVKNGYTYLSIGIDGKVYQAHSIDQWGYHCGSSAWKALGSGLSDRLIGIEICCGGKLSKKGDQYFTWFDKEVPAANVRYSDGKAFQGEPGYYEKMTDAQEKSLIELLVWLKSQRPAIFKTGYILGHDMVSGVEGIGYARKNDPGASLSIPIRELQKIVQKEYENY